MLMIDAVAFAGGRLEAVAISDRDLAVMVADQSRALQLASSHGHPCAPHSEHRGEELVRHRHDIQLNAVVRHEQPTSESLLDRVQPIAGRSLGAEVHESGGEAKHSHAYGRALVER